MRPTNPQSHCSEVCSWRHPPQTLELRKHAGASFNGIGWADDVRIGVADIGVGVRVVESGLVWVDGPCCNVDL